MRKCKLGKLLDVTRGVSISGAYCVSEGERVRLTLANFDYVNNCFQEDHGKDNLFYSKEVPRKFILDAGSIITPLTEQTPGLLGSTARIPESGKYIQSQDVGLIKPFEDVLDHDFAYYLVSSKGVKDQLAARSQQTKIRHTSPDKIKDCTVFVPDLSDQRKIGKFLSSVDRLIELSRKRIENLEKLAKEIYDYWFVQFDFPDKNGKPYKSSGGKMVYNTKLKREIPAGWSVTPLKNLIANVNTGLNPRDNFKFGGNIKYLTVKNLTTRGLLDLSKCDMICEAAREMVHKRSDIDVGDILFASIEPLGRCYLIQEKPKNWDINESIFSIRPNYEAVTSEYLFHFFMSEWFIIKASRQSVGSIFKGIRINELQRMDVLLPCRDTVLAYGEKLRPIFKMIDSAAKSIHDLTQLREFLLPLLMNGQAKINL